MIPAMFELDNPKHSRLAKQNVTGISVRISSHVTIGLLPLYLMDEEPTSAESVVRGLGEQLIYYATQMITVPMVTLGHIYIG